MAHFLLQRLSLAAGLLTFSVAAFGQVEPVKFGKIDPKDFEKASFVGDSAASAVILCDYGRSHFEMGAKGDLVVVFDHVRRIKILKKGGYDWADGDVMLYHKGSNSEKLSNLRGFTYNVGTNGEITKDKLESTAVFSEELDANHTRRKFTLPNVHEGSVVEYAYTITSDYLFNFQDWNFQHSIPVRWSEYRASIPEYFDYKQLWQGYEPLAVQERTAGSTQFIVRVSSAGNGNWMTSRAGATSSETVTAQVTNYRWVTKDTPALRPEPFMTTPRDYVTRINFELAGIRWPNSAYENVSGTWAKMQRDLLNDTEFGGQLSRGGFLKPQVAAVVAQYSNEAERAAAIHALVRDNVASTGIGTKGLWSDAGIRKAWEQHRGSAADVNLLLITLLRDAGLKANPVILSTREHGRVDTNFPLISRFNYVVAHVQLPDSQQVLVDATESMAPFGMLPAACLSGQGRLILGEEAGAWVPLNSPHRYVHFRSAKLTLDERGNLTGTLRDEQGGYLGLRQRDELRQQGEKKYVESLLKQQEGWKVDKFAFQNAKDLSKPLMLDMDLRVPGDAEQPLGTIYLSVLHALNEATNPFLQPERRFPVDFGSRREETNMVTLTLPDNYVVEELPKNTLVEIPNGGGRFLFSITPVGNTLQITSRMTLNRSMYLADEYPHLRQFYTLMLAKQAEKIVLKRKS